MSISRRRTSVTVWPAIADLMTVIAIMAGLISIAQCAVTDNKTPEELEITSKERDSLQFALNKMTKERDSLQSELDKKPGKGLGSRPCLGFVGPNQTHPLIAISVLPGNRYHITMVPDIIHHPLIEELLPIIPEGSLNRLQLINLREKIIEFGKEQPDGGCSFSVRLQSSVGKEELRNRYYGDVGFSLTNPGILY